MIFPHPPNVNAHTSTQAQTQAAGQRQRRRLAATRLRLVEGGHAGEHLALEELERRAAAGGDVGHLVGEARLLNRRDGVTAADDGDAVEVGQGVGDAEGALGEGIHLKHTHGTVPDDGLALLELRLEGRDGVGADVEAHPAVGDGVHGDDLGVGVGGELVGDHHVGGQQQLHALRRRLRHQLLGQLNLVVLHQGGAHLLAHGLVEGEDHAAAEDDDVGLGEQGLDDADLGGDLGAAHDGAERAVGVGHGAVQVVQLLLEEEAGDGGGEELGDALGGGVRAVGGAERVVDVQVGVGGQHLGKVAAVLLLLGVEANVLQQQHGAGRHGGARLGNDLAHAVVDLGDRAGQQLGQAHAHGGEPELVLWALRGAAQVGGDHHLGAHLDEVLEGGDGGADAGVVGDLHVLVEGHVEVAAHEHRLPLELCFRQVSDGLLLCLNLEGRGAGRLGGGAGLRGHGGLREERAGGEGGGGGSEGGHGACWLKGGGEGVRDWSWG
mmetsp:Transcript_11079/g.26960  ORF Transcript_11079/g.26960 Transcript_11079/m.26960 type:complete len:493 (+) Transcript_11079:174-1652(+)